MNKPKKRYIIRKYVMAESATQAMKLEKNFRVEDVWVDEKWVEANLNHSGSIGFEAKRS